MNNFLKLDSSLYLKLVHISDVNQLLIQYYLLIVEKRSSIHDPLIIQQQNLQYNQQTMMGNDDSAKWILEPLVICPLDPTAFLRKELIEVCFQEKSFYEK